MYFQRNRYILELICINSVRPEEEINDLYYLLCLTIIKMSKNKNGCRSHFHHLWTTWRKIGVIRHKVNSREEEETSRRLTSRSCLARRAKQMRDATHRTCAAAHANGQYSFADYWGKVFYYSGRESLQMEQVFHFGHAWLNERSPFLLCFSILNESDAAPSFLSFFI